jgi:serine protease AprX
MGTKERREAMNKTQKRAWFTFALAMLLIAFFAIVFSAMFAGGDRSAGTGLARVGSWVIVLFMLAGAVYLHRKQSPAEPTADERDITIRRKAVSVSYISVWVLLALASLLPAFVVGDSGSIPVYLLPIINVGVFIGAMLVYSVATLAQYGLRSNAGAAKTCVGIFAVSSIVFLGGRAVAGADVPIAGINEKVEQLTVGESKLEDIVRVFGEPTKYIWENQTFTKENLPATYVAVYPDDLHFMLVKGLLDEIRFEGPGWGYVFAGTIKVGSSLEGVLAVLGPPARTVVGDPIGFEDGVLYKDVDGFTGHCYYSRSDWKVRMFFRDYKVTALYLTAGESSTGGGAFGTIHPVSSVEPFDDVRFGDLSKLDLSQRPGLLETLTFNLETVWPPADRLPSGSTPLALLRAATNPGLGVRRLHTQGITGKGVSVAIIDQPMYLDHPEFAGKIVEYYDTGCGSESSMHGPAVTSLLVGSTCGTAPDANLYYAAAPSWNQDSAYYANALDWIITKNAQLAAPDRIRVVSVSAAPSGPGSPFTKNNDLWDQACLRAAEQGILVLDCTTHHGFISSCWCDTAEPENVAKCTPGFPGLEGAYRKDKLLASSSVRTTAQEYEKGKCGYQYTGRGGLSWGIPYVAGVLALGWQVNPQRSAEQMKQWLFESAYVNEDGVKIIQPESFIELVQGNRGDKP